MDHHEEVTVTRSVVVKTTCDLCGAEIGKGPNPAIGPAGAEEVTIAHQRVKHDACGTCERRTLDLDVCPACFRDKVLPALRSLGLTRDYEEWVS